ncbi:MAG: efflux RND transporter periplasmic adaptor subunit, partial [Planctomycetaceae bacterium]|nr:efflux RND transporter periplasmic adaptor subunit [Planctomycetaceae bacterium]
AQDLGVISVIQVREGETVQQGDLLIRLNDQDAELQLRQAQQQLDIAKQEAGNQIRMSLAEKTSEVAQAELQRALKANEKYAETVSKTEVNRLKLIAEKAELECNQAAHDQQMMMLSVELKRLDLEVARNNLERRQIRAPISGVVQKIDKRPGEWVQPGTRLLQLIDLKTLRAEATLPARYRHEMLKNRVVTINSGTQNEQGQPILVQGRITFILPEFNPVDGSFRIWAELENANLVLRPGESVTMQILDDVAPEESQNTPES